MKMLLCIICMFSFLFAKEVETPFKNLEGLEVIGVSPAGSRDEGKNAFLQKLQKNISTLLQEGGYKNITPLFFMRNKEVSKESISLKESIKKRLYQEIEKEYDRNFPDYKIVLNMLDERSTRYEQTQNLRKSAIQKLYTMKTQTASSSNLSQRVYIIRHGNDGFTIKIQESIDNPYKPYNYDFVFSFGTFSKDAQEFVYIQTLLKENTKAKEQFLFASENMLFQKLFTSIKTELKNFYALSSPSTFDFVAKKEVIRNLEEPDRDYTKEGDQERYMFVEYTSSPEDQLKSIDEFLLGRAKELEEFLNPKTLDSAIWMSYYWRHKSKTLKTYFRPFKNYEQALIKHFTRFSQKHNKVLRLYLNASLENKRLEKKQNLEIFFKRYINENIKDEHLKVIMENIYNKMDKVELLAFSLGVFEK